MSESTFSGQHMACRYCGAATPIEVLSNLGARCHPCYDAYLRDPRPATPNVGDKKRNGTRDWIGALREREQAGEKLSPFQRQAWREAQRTRPGMGHNESEES